MVEGGTWWGTLSHPPTYQLEMDSAGESHSICVRAGYRFQFWSPPYHPLSSDILLSSHVMS